MSNIVRLGCAYLILNVSMTGCWDPGITSAGENPDLLPQDARVFAEDRAIIERGRDIFRHDDFGDWRFWTDTARLNSLVEGVSPLLALQLGLKVDSDAVPPDVLDAVLNDPVLLADPATTRALLELNAVVGLAAEVAGNQIVRLGTTCALCHSTVDNSVTAGIGRRLDGAPNRELALGSILSLLPGLPAIAASLGVGTDVLLAEFQSWPPGFYDARVNLDGEFAAPPVVIPPAYGLRGVGLETYTGEGPISYWNAYVAVTQMHGRGAFSDPRLGIAISLPRSEDEVTSKLPALRAYQYSLSAPTPPAGSFDVAAAARGRAIFRGKGTCARCHVGPQLTDRGHLHAASETGMEPTWAARSTTKKYRTTPLRGLSQHAPYFHDGSAPSLDAVVDHYDGILNLGLSTQHKADLVEYLKSL